MLSADALAHASPSKQEPRQTHASSSTPKPASMCPHCGLPPALQGTTLPLVPSTTLSHSLKASVPLSSPSSGAASHVLELYLKYILPLATASHVSVLFLCFLNSQLLEKVVHASPHNHLPSLPIFQPTWLLAPPHHRTCSGQGHQQLSCCPGPGCTSAAQNPMPKPSSLGHDSIGLPNPTTQFPLPHWPLLLHLLCWLLLLDAT